MLENHAKTNKEDKKGHCLLSVENPTKGSNDPFLRSLIEEGRPLTGVSALSFLQCFSWVTGRTSGCAICLFPMFLFQNKCRMKTEGEPATYVYPENRH